MKRRKRVEDRFTDPLPCEIDNHADTTCFGKNFRVTSFTSEVCSVSPFLSEYDSVTDVPICNTATAVDLESGETIILEFGQGLWFGDRMDHSLINPNQCRSFGISLCDDPTDPNRNIGLELSDDYVVPVHMRGTTCHFLSRSPSISEIESCRTFKLTDTETWNPADDIFQISSAVRGHCVSRVNVSDPCMNHLRDLCSYDLCLCDFYDFDRLQENHTHTIAQIRTSERHHGVNADLLSLKWGIGVEKAKNTIKHTTQMNVRSAFLPLT